MLLFLLTTMIISYYINGYLGFFMSIISFYSYMSTLKKYKESNIELIIGLLIISIPTSFINIFGKDYGISPLSWFNIILIIGILYMVVDIILIKKRTINLSLLSIFISMFIIVGFISLIKNFSSITTFLTINIPIAFALLILIGYKNLSIDCNRLINLYVKLVLASCIALLLQIFSYKLLGIKLGYIREYSNREAFGVLFTDFSFISLYIASGAIICIYRGLKKNSFKELITGFFICLCSILTSARTGLAGILVSFGIIFILGIFSKNKKESFKYIIISPILLGFIILVFMIMSELRKGQSLFDFTGRFKTYETALLIFKNNFLTGIGMGVNNYQDYIKENIYNGHLIIPHNIVIQFLAQTGIIGTIIMSIFLSIITFNSFCKIDKSMAFSFTTCLVGSFFIPDIFNSRFFILIIILIIIQNKTSKNIYTKKQLL